MGVVWLSLLKARALALPSLIASVSDMKIL
jgi:hypothetical protein